MSTATNLPSAPPEIYSETEIALANRNKGMPLEMLRYDITPVGMHYMLTHFDMPHVDADTFRLEIGGLVGMPTTLTLDDIQAVGSQTLAVTLECAGNGRTRLSPRPTNMPWGVEAISTAEWTGVSLRDVIARVGVQPEAVELVFSAPDEGTQKGLRHFYQRSLTPGEIERPEIMLAWAMNGRPLEPQHGAPLRLIVPGWYGMASVKWIHRIDAVSEPFQGMQQANSYTIRKTPDDVREPITRIRVRALMTPPGRPDFPSLDRVADVGVVTLSGRAWSGQAPIAGVEVAVDGHWADARLEDPVGPFVWRAWTFDWDATPGPHTLSCRATDADGRT
ncbi:MAG: sulfite oxidase, partial [Chloroflexota bacterium]